MSSTVEGLDRGIAGTSKTISKMDKLVALGKLDPTMQKIATWIRMSVPEDARGSTKKTLDAVFHWVRRHAIFQRDPFQIEKIEHPIEAMRAAIELRKAGKYDGPGLFVGDCDTIAGVYIATLIGILGFQYAWETAKVDSSRPDEFSHIWTSALVDGDWYPLDPSTRGAYPGWRPPVSGDLFKRWPEKPIEETLGMSGMNGSHRNSGVGYDPNGPMVPQEYFDSGITRFYGGNDYPIDVPPPDPGDLDVHIPPDNALSRDDLRPGLPEVQRVPTPRPQERPMQIQPGDDYAPSPNYQPRREYISISPHGGASPQYPFANQVEVIPGEPIEVRRRNGEVILKPERIQGMSGMGESAIKGYDAFGNPVYVGQSTPIVTTTSTATKVEQAGATVMTDISKIIAGVAGAAGSVAVASIQAKAAEAVAKATLKVGSQQGVQVTPPPYVPPSEGTSFWKNPLVWAVGILTVGGGGFLLTRRSRSRR